METKQKLKEDYTIVPATQQRENKIRKNVNAHLKLGFKFKTVKENIQIAIIAERN